MEIERKFRVKKDVWFKSEKPAGEKIVQGYLCMEKDQTVRIRLIGGKGYLTIKGKTINISREEFEFPVPADIAAEMLEKLVTKKVEKTRYSIIYNGKLWEVDEFSGSNEGLIVAEVELNDENENIERLPEWVGAEVSHEARYYNVNLSVHPFKEWEDE